MSIILYYTPLISIQYYASEDSAGFLNCVLNLRPIKKVNNRGPTKHIVRVSSWKFCYHIRAKTLPHFRYYIYEYQQWFWHHLCTAEYYWNEALVWHSFYIYRGFFGFFTFFPSSARVFYPGELYESSNRLQWWWTHATWCHWEIESRDILEIYGQEFPHLCVACSSTLKIDTTYGAR